MTRISIKQILYGVLAILGVLLPWYFNIQFILETNGSFNLSSLLAFDWTAFTAGGFANPAASSITVDFFIVAMALLVWMVPEARRLGLRWWFYIILAGLVSAAFAFPLFLLMRERKLEKARR